MTNVFDLCLRGNLKTVLVKLPGSCHAGRSTSYSSWFPWAITYEPRKHTSKKSTNHKETNAITIYKTFINLLNRNTTYRNIFKQMFYNLMFFITYITYESNANFTRNIYKGTHCDALLEKKNRNEPPWSYWINSLQLRSYPYGP